MSDQNPKESDPKDPIPTLGDAVAEHLYKRLFDLGMFNKEPLNTGHTESDIDQMTMDLAIANQKYYLESAKKDGKPWFHHPKYPHMYSETILCTPDMARALMAENIDNRNLSVVDAEAHARDMANGRWLQTEESLGIDVRGIFYNGQHRAKGVIIADKAVPLYFTFQVPTSARFVEDSGRRRQAKQKLQMLLGKDQMPNNATAVCRAMMEGSIRTNTKPSESEIGNFLLRYNEVIRWVYEMMPKTRADVQAATAKAALWYGNRAIVAFCERFKSVVFKKEDDPAGALYKWLQRIRGQSGVQGVIVYRKTAYAIDADLHGKGCIKLQERKNDFFEWTAGWEVPQK